MFSFFHVCFNRREEIEQIDTASPLNCKDKTVMNKKQNVYIKPTKSIPFWDAQKVEASIPLSGINFHYKSAAHCGGFLALEVLTIDYFPYLNKEDNVNLVAQDPNSFKLRRKQHKSRVNKPTPPARKVPKNRRRQHH